MFKWRAILANDKDFILNLCNQMISEEKLLAIPNILKLSKYKVLFSQIQTHFKRKEQRQHHYIEEQYYNNITAVDLLGEQLYETQSSYENIYIHKTLEEKEFI